MLGLLELLEGVGVVSLVSSASNRDGGRPLRTLEGDATCELSIEEEYPGKPVCADASDVAKDGDDRRGRRRELQRLVVSGAHKELGLESFPNDMNERSFMFCDASCVSTGLGGVGTTGGVKRGPAAKGSSSMSKPSK